jgi:hypothetical protein
VFLPYHLRQILEAEIQEFFGPLVQGITCEEVGAEMEPTFGGAIFEDRAGGEGFGEESTAKVTAAFPPASQASLLDTHVLGQRSGGIEWFLLDYPLELPISKE